MQERRSLYLLISLVAVVALLVCASAVYALYEAALHQQRQQLAEMVKVQARLMEAMFQHEEERPGGSREYFIREVLDQVRNAFAHYDGFSETGAFMLARREGDRIVFLSSQRDEQSRHPEFVPYVGTRAEPMRRALNGLSGVIVTTDYRGVPVISAYEPVPELGVGLVAKIDLEEVRAPYVHAGAVASLVAAVAVIFGGLLVVRTTQPLLRQIRRSEQNLRALTENAQDGILVNLDGRHVYANRRLAEMLGYAPEALLDTTLMDLVHPDERSRVEERYHRRLAGEPVTSQYETVFVTKSGARVPVEINAARTEWQGRPAVLVLARDISLRLRAEQALRDREAQYRAVIETSADGFWVVDMEGRLREVNDAYVRRSGYTREELLGMRVTDLEAKESADETAAHIARVMHEGSDLFESWHRAKDGSRWPVEINVTHWPAAGGRLFVFLRDISARHVSEAQMQKLSHALEQTADAVMVTDRNGIIEYVNPALETMTGYTRAELLGRTPDVFRSGIQDDGFYRRLWSAILGGEIFSDVLVNRRKDGSLYYEEKLISPIKGSDGSITHFVATGRDISERMAAQVRLAHLAHHDTLTELPNRTLFLDRLKQALARARWHGRLVAVIFLDLDRFKVINDTLGHDTGDRLLQQMSARLHSSVRERDTVARFGGDEFAILLDDMASENDVGHVAQKVLDALAPPFEIDGRELYVSASLGISQYPNDGDDARALLKNADTAMYRAKESGKNNYQFYSADMSAHALERLTLESSLRQALGRNEFTLHYQPQVDVRSGAVLGVEALLRWRQPGRGLVGPGDYISLLEETGLILPVGEWVLTTACEQLRAWRAAGWDELRLAVNLSARQVADPGFAGLLERLVTQHGCVADKLELEITESVLMQQTRNAVENIEAAHRLGVRIALDDFGTGYSSLSYLQRFPIDTLKIDRSFISDLPGDADDALLTEAILNMARSLRIAVIAEGVETTAQRDFLSARGCHLMQGYLLGHPVPAAEIARRAPASGTGVN